MSTFIINLNDTTVINDSIFAKVVKLSEVCQPVVMEAETNNFDWYIVATICGAVIIVASIACYAVLSWKEIRTSAFFVFDFRIPPIFPHLNILTISSLEYS